MSMVLTLFLFETSLIALGAEIGDKSIAVSGVVSYQFREIGDYTQSDSVMFVVDELQLASDVEWPVVAAQEWNTRLTKALYLFLSNVSDTMMRVVIQ